MWTKIVMSIPFLFCYENVVHKHTYTCIYLHTHTHQIALFHPLSYPFIMEDVFTLCHGIQVLITLHHGIQVTRYQEE